MSLDLEQRLRVFLASAPQNIWNIETLEISHSSMSKTYYLWKEPYAGVITLEDSSTREVSCLNFEVKLASSQGNLDQSYDITLDLTDSEDEFKEQMDRIPIDTTEKIKLVFREYLSDDLTEVQSSAILQVETIAYSKSIARFTAISPRLNVLRTGELYTTREVPMLRGFT
jgi:hypothetical protein